jgi:hypothetical protein
MGLDADMSDMADVDPRCVAVSTDPMPSCSDSSFPRDVSTLMRVYVRAGEDSTTTNFDVTIRNTYDDGFDILESQTSHEQFTAGIVSRILRDWQLGASGNTDIYTLQPLSVDPVTFAPAVNKTTLATGTALNILPTWPHYAQTILDCTADANPAECMNEGLVYRSRDDDFRIIRGERCQMFDLVDSEGDSAAEICVPTSCEMRHTLYPMFLYGSSASGETRTDFIGSEDVTPADDDLFRIPTPCFNRGEAGVYCTPPAAD